MIEPVIRVYPKFGLTELLEVGNTVGLIASLSNTQANFALARAQAYQGVTTMRELTDRELDAVGGGALGFQLGFLAKQVQNTANNSVNVTQGWALANIAAVTQTNVQIGQIT